MADVVYRQGDLFDHDMTRPTIIAHVVNDLGVWGAGFVVPLGEHFPRVKLAYQMGSGIYALGDTQLVATNTSAHGRNVTVANMFGQVGVGPRGYGSSFPARRPNLLRRSPAVSYGHLATAMDAVHKTALILNADIIAPKFGAGLGGGDWGVIEQMVYDLWVSRGVDVTIYTLDE